MDWSVLSALAPGGAGQVGTSRDWSAGTKPPTRCSRDLGPGNFPETLAQFPRKICTIYVYIYSAKNWSRRAAWSLCYALPMIIPCRNMQIMRRQEELSNFQLEHARQQYDEMDNAVEQLTRNVLLKAHAQNRSRGTCKRKRMSRTCERRVPILLQRQENRRNSVLEFSKNDT
jgi:hypothetical protein